MNIKFYNLMIPKNSNSITSTRVKICYTIEDLYKSSTKNIQESLDKNENKAIVFVDYNLMKDDSTRLVFLTNLVGLFPDEYKEKENIVIENSLVTPTGKVIKIDDYDKVSQIIDLLYDKEVEELKKEYGGDDISKDEVIGILTKEESNSESNLDSVKASIKMEFIMKLLDNFIEENKEELQESFLDAMIHNPEIDNDIPKTELELVNIEITNILKDEAKDLQFQECRYNGKVISQEELLNELNSHVFPQFLTQKNINDTLDDEYRIETDKLTIIREPGGALHLKRKD